MIRTRFTALMYAGILVSVLILILSGIIYVVAQFPVVCISIAATGLLVIYYKSIYKELKSRNKEKEWNRK